jgi:hypothetical protein
MNVQQSLVLSKKDKAIIDKYQEEFSKIYYKFSPNKNPFYLSPSTYKFITTIFPNYFKLVAKLVDDEDILENWESENIMILLGKALIPDSFSPTQQNANLLIEDINKNNLNKHLFIKQLSLSAGLTTILIYLGLINSSEKKFTLIACDSSLESIVSTALLLSIFNVPHTIIKGRLDDQIKKFDGVVLQYYDVLTSLEDDKENKRMFDYIISDNGISYYSQTLHDKIVSEIDSITEKNSIVLISSLEPKIKIKLDSFHIFKEILLSKGKSAERIQLELTKRKELIKAKKLQSDSLQYEFKMASQGTQIITKFYTLYTAQIYNMLNAFLFDNEFKSLHFFNEYIDIISQITKAARNLVEEVQSSIFHTQEYIIKNNLKFKTEIFPSDKKEERCLVRAIKMIKY